VKHTRDVSLEYSIGVPYKLLNFMQKHCGKYIFPSNNIEGMQLRNITCCPYAGKFMYNYNGPNLTA